MNRNRDGKDEKDEKKPKASAKGAPQKKRGGSGKGDDDDLDAMKQIVKLQNQYDYSSEEEFGDPDDNEEIYIR